ncbi:hypothetical protein IE81DRAFT_325904 [Ceraceosorus guamensis]|uniref:Uncharacterized protein n=1 Tax=Ceraceosorus guamensis TaxID=1522189 RepID=A0A316VUY9_9BASI|nr:hypothetical protein IE81DRAFT_325904 [Ceraceosorus guamensis]PWN40101.1 hypothetical protein IE81DRAFT_325904 [Ceraceosorus guamensis]
MFDEFVQSSRGADHGAASPLFPIGGRGPRERERERERELDGVEGFEDDLHARSPGLEFGAAAGGSVPVTALETGFVSSDLDIGGGVGATGSSSSSSGAPIFQLGRVQYAFPAPLACLTVCNNILTMCLYAHVHAHAHSATGAASLSSSPSAPPPPPATAAAAAARPRLVRINLDDPERTEEAEIPLPPLPRTRSGAQDPSLDQSPHKMFSDPSGRHLLISTRSGDNFYWSSGWKRARILSKLKGIVVECVAWNRAALSEGVGSVAASTLEILLGTRSGQVYETVLVAPLGGDPDAGDGDFFDRLARRAAGVGGAANAASGLEIDRVLRKLCTLPEEQPVTGLVAEPLVKEAGGGGRAAAERAVVVVTTSTRIYEFVGALGKKARSSRRKDADALSDTSESLYAPIFEPYSKQDIAPPLRSELPGDLPYSELHTWGADIRKAPKSLAWLTGPGVYYGRLLFVEDSSDESVLVSANLLPYPAVSALEEQGEDGAVAEIPLSIALSEFHFLLLYQDRITGISALDDRVVFEEALPLKPHERVIRTTFDPARKTYWIYTDGSIFEVVVKDEDRDVWWIYLQRGQFDAALKHAKDDVHRDAVLSKQGDRFFAEARYIQAAQCYAKAARRGFEEIVLKFLDLGQNDALRYFLVARLERLRKTEVTQRIMLATWLIEIYLGKITSLEDTFTSAQASPEADNYKLERQMLEEELRAFFATYKDCLDAKTVFGLIGRHGRTELELAFAEVVGDYERIVRHWIGEGNWSKVIETISSQPSLDLYYRFASVLMRNASSATVKAWTRQDALQPRRLIPALLQYRPRPGQANEAVRYLQHVVHEQYSSDPAVHNLLLTLLAKGEGSASSEAANSALLSFIDDSRSNPISGAPYFDLDYALRTCSAQGRHEACVRIYAKMKLYESAVDMALDRGDVESACLCAELVTGDAELRRRLWLKAAKYVVQNRRDLKAAMTFLSRTDLLSIEDILPFFPDFVVIDDFKDEICASLESYASRIQLLKEEMEEASRSAEAIRADTRALDKRFVTVESDEKCALCEKEVWNRQFYVFPCKHAFHADCLIAETTRHLHPKTLRRVFDLQEQLSALTAGLIPALPPSYASALASMSRAAVTLPLGGLNSLREYVLPDQVISAISAGVSVGVSSSRKVLDPLARNEAWRNSSAAAAQPEPESAGAGAGATATATATEEEEERIEKLRDELDGILASACAVCDGAVSAISRPFVNVAASNVDAKEADDWAL